MRPSIVSGPQDEVGRRLGSSDDPTIISIGEADLLAVVSIARIDVGERGRIDGSPAVSTILGSVKDRGTR